MLKWKISFCVMLLLCNSSYASQSISNRVNITATMALNTCALTLTPDNVNFGGVRIDEIEAASISPQTVSLSMQCSWPASGVSVKFVPKDGVSTSDPNIMKTGLSGVGLALSWKKSTVSDFTNINYNTSLQLNAQEQSSNVALGQFKLLPKKVPEQTIQSGNIATSLTVEVSYD
ncbi:TPA: fimbrial protein [Escherichia coli]|uniref:fimbrial protein n=1 Tax=Escherichia coli TaxID=562 RepID=UPI000DFD2D5B|nr:fimbrial protein [Escherichia coli]MDF1288781.1 fimbrial protein [Escherichia coli]STL62963.1 putative fimbrial protein FanG [Escherichia coli]HAI2297989.1 fimbrial protein [Escherichia coli]HBN7514049.1 fimbrial protein [Escherichia coli]HCO5162200.1 fimbrial protein [Escherichia coli]